MARGPAARDGLVPLTTTTPVLGARNAVASTFAMNGFLFASLVSRIPDLRTGLSLDNGALGLLLLAIAAGSVLALPSAGALIQRSSASAVVRVGTVCSGVGLLLAGLWDVAMNVEGAEVERQLGRSIMSRFHAAWSLGSITGAAVGIPMAAVHAPLPVHFGVLSGLGLLLVLRATRDFLPVQEQESARSSGTAWLEPRTLALGLMVLTFTVAEGSANDWLSLALIDGYDLPHWMGVAGYAVFVIAMTVGRVSGPVVLDRFGRAPVLWVSAGAAAVGILLVVFGGHPVLVCLGILVWGLGAALGFPVGISAAADDAARSAARVSVVSTIGYGAFLAGPPLLGALADQVGTLEALLAVACLMVPAALTAFAARPTGASPVAR